MGFHLILKYLKPSYCPVNHGFPTQVISSCINLSIYHNFYPGVSALLSISPPEKNLRSAAGLQSTPLLVPFVTLSYCSF